MTAGSGTFSLRREVERLVTATYAPSLQNLYNLTQEVTPTLIDSWASHKPCQVGALAEVLVDGLSRSRLALSILSSFGRAPGFRDYLLQQHPYLLDQFLQQSTGNDEAEYVPVCISLLSSPLPRSTVPPASLVPFVMKMVGRVQESPSVDNVRSLYSISGCLTGILRELPQDVMSCLQIELTKTLRDLKDHMGNLLCLATFARLASSWSSVEFPSWLQNVKNFFGPKRGLKTLDLVVLRVILACSANCEGLTAEQSAESIYLAIEICNTVDMAQRRCWIEGNSIKIAKLIEKATRDGINHSVQTLGLSFLASLLPESALSPYLARLPLEWIVPENSVNVLEVLPSHILPHLVEANAAHSHQYALNKVLGYVFAVLSSKSDDIAVDGLRLARSLLDGLRASELPPLPPAFISSMSKRYGDAVQDLVENYPRQPSFSDCEGVAACYHAVSNLENELIFDLLTFWLKMTLSQRIEQVASPSSELNILMKIMTKSKSMLPQSRCTFSDARPLALRNCPPLHRVLEKTNISRGDWRAGMKDIMAANSRMVNDSIMQKVEHICYELEQRCGSIEAPLKKAEEERSQQYLEAERLKRQTKDLEDELQVASTTISELREEMSHLEIYANSATGRAEELSMSLTEARQALEDLQSTSEGTLAGEREAFRTRELDMIASLSAKDDHLEGLQEQLKSQTEEHAQLETMLVAISKEKDSFHESIVTLKHEVSILRAEVQERDKEIQSLMTGKEVADNQTEELQAKLHEEATESEGLRAALRDTIEKSKAELEEIRMQSELQYSKMAEEATQQKSKIMTLQRAMQEATSNATRDLQTREKRIQRLERKVQHLRDERAAKAREFIEAQQHISRLMSVMGFKPTSPDNRASSKHRARPLPEPSHFAMMQTQTDTVAGDSQSQSRGDDLLATSMEISTPRPGPCSPKRSRNTAFPSAQPSPPRSQETNKKSKEPAFQGIATLRRERRPLAEADANSQPNSQLTQVSITNPRDEFHGSQCSNQADQNYLDDIDLEFSKEFVFTSTSLSELNGHTHGRG
ncbi:hypothetical protein ASPCAL10991 [Aspergillus calidoustus]|uniref:Uncharacterized protein n=1 Tax=Aspergillus calidoustus TaxID=454130 RepID=A0A0U5GA68_ASPCI|nr:hypothetical protein ASPCAL10991 [Aspergillus calidoustus]